MAFFKKWFVYFCRLTLKKTGPEAGQYFHVRPPIGFIKMGYKAQEKEKKHKKTSAIKSVLSHFRPVSHLRDNGFRQCFVRLGSFSVTQG